MKQLLQPRPLLNEADEAISKIIANALEPALKELEQKGLIPQSSGTDILQRTINAAHRELVMQFRGPRMFAFGILDEGAAFLKAGMVFVKTGDHSAVSTTGSPETIKPSEVVVYDPTLDFLQ